ncbi:MAG: alpha/beta hydrolase [Candidatus Lernaella stagnicola]|nr:alpha/beta hydrolase [Candidatus Lernaella stagnicola]
MSDTSSSAKPKLVFVHGAWHGPWSWDLFVEFFTAAGWTCDRVTLAGHDGGPQPDDFNTYEIERYTHSIEEVTGGDANVVLIGHSMGGLTIQHYLGQHETRGAVFVAGVPYYGIPWNGVLLTILSQSPLKTISMLRRGRRFETAAEVRDHFYLPNTPAELIEKNFARMVPESAAALRRLSLKGKFAGDPPAPLGNPPRLVLAAGHDHFLSPPYMEEFARTYGSDFEVFLDMPHNLMDAPGWEKVAETIAKWLAESVLRA